MPTLKRALYALLFAGASALGQITNPVYLDESPAARETLAQTPRLLATGNRAEAARQLQRLLDDEGDRVVADDPDLAIGVRERVLDALLANPELLAAYRAAENARARRDLDEGREHDAERTRLLTTPGFEAALRVAQAHLETARFEAARLTLEQLERHPDRTGPLATDAADLLWTVAAYLDRPEVWEHARRWMTDSARLAPSPHRAERPVIADRSMRSPLSLGPPFSTAELSGAPLSSASVEARPEAPSLAARLRLYPAASGEDLFLSDGSWLHAFDRFTLDLRWRARLTTPGARDPASPMNVGEDPLLPVVQGRIVVVPSEDPPGSMSRVHAYEATTGRLLWSVHLPSLDPRLEASTIHGPLTIDADRVLFSARKSGAAQRLLSVYVGGLDLATGELRWLRLMASAGSLPFQRSRSVSDTGLLDRGIIYRMDYVGAIGAYEAATGRPVWVRKLPVADFGQSELGEPWQGNAPILDDDTLFVLAPDRRDIHRLDARTGRLLASRPAAVFGQAQYLIRAGDYLGAVDSNSITFVERGRFESGPVRRSAILPNAGIRGRVVVSGTSVLAPIERGVARIDPADPGSLHLAALDAPGNLVVLADELITAGPRSVHAYASWAVVSQLLSERMEAHPADPGPAVTFAELAFRARVPDEIVRGADRAIAILERAPAGDPAAAAARARLFQSLRAMVDASFADPGAHAITPGVLASLVDRLGRLADSHAERVAHLFSLGSLKESTSAHADAFAAYQRVLLEPLLGESLWRGSGAAARADLEATRRIHRLLLASGAAGYLAFEIAARQEFASLPVGATAQAFEAIARRYPASTVSPRAWLNAALLHERDNRLSASVLALSAALDRAESLKQARVPIDPILLGEIVGRLARAYQQAERFSAAAQLLRRVSRDDPTLPISDGSVALNVSELLASLVHSQSALRRPPRLGTEIRPDVQALVGWRILQPLSRENFGRTADHLVLSREPTRDSPAGAIALWGVAGAAGPGSSDRPGELRPLWERAVGPTPPVLLRADPDASYLYWPSSQGGSIERIDSVEGGPGWTSPPFATLFGPQDSLEGRLTSGPETSFDVPLQGSRRLVDLLAGIDSDLVALVERSGRAALFDDATGRLIWKLTTPMRQVYDIELGHGVLVLAGRVGEPLGDLGEDLLPAILILDARTGELRHRLESNPDDPPRWVLLADPGLVIVARQSSISAIRLSDGSTAWTIVGGAGWESREAWVFDDRLIVMGEDRKLWLASASAGLVLPNPIDAREPIEEASRVEAFRSGPNIGFSSDRGVILVDERGVVVGRDALDRVGGLLPAAPTTDHLVILDATPETLPDGRPAFELHFLGSGSAIATDEPRKLVLRARPRAMAILEGRLVVTAGNITTVFHAPASDAR